MEKNIYNPEYVKKLFNRMSKSYERMNYITSFGFSIRWRTQFINSFHHSRDKPKTIDLLTGMGETWKAIKDKLPNSSLTALDFSEEMLKYADKKNKTEYRNEVVILQQNILENELPNDYYDFVTCAFGLKTFNNEQLNHLAHEVKRILKTNGQFSFVEVSKPNNRILKILYGFYLGQVIPILGRLLLTNPEEYKMLWKYTNKFENAINANTIFKNAGLKTNFVTYFHGCATGFYGSKL